MRKLIILIGITFGFLSCEDDLHELNKDPKATDKVDAANLFTYGQYNIAKQITDIDYNNNVDRLWANYLTQTTYIQEASYDAANRDVGGSIWDNIYTESLLELKRAKEILRSEEVSEALKPQRNNKLATILIMEVYAYQYLVDNFGDVPFTEALDIDNLTPAYDEAEFIYGAIADSLQTALGMINASEESWAASTDILYGGDMAKWKKFGNSVLLKMGMRLAEADNATASSLVTAAVDGGVFTSNGDNAVYNFSANQPYTNPIYDYFVVDSRNSDFVATQFFIDLLQDLNDPRIDAYLEDNIAGGYTGGEYGAIGNAYANLTHIDEALVEATFPGVLLDYATVSFLLAEAVERNFIAGTVVDAAGYYEDGIRASFDVWGVSGVDAYLAQADVAYATAPGTFQEKIGRQKYIALYNQGHEAWTEARRLDAPALLPAASNNVPNPKRMIYPVEEVLINEAAYNNAGGKSFDKTSSPIFWDVD